MTNQTARDITIDQIERYEGWLVTSSIDRPGVYRQGSIGETIRRLSPDEQEKLTELKSDDLNNVRPRLYPAHPSKTTTRVFRIPHDKP